MNVHQTIAASSLVFALVCLSAANVLSCARRAEAKDAGAAVKLSARDQLDWDDHPKRFVFVDRNETTIEMECDPDAGPLWGSQCKPISVHVFVDIPVYGMDGGRCQ